LAFPVGWGEYLAAEPIRTFQLADVTTQPAVDGLGTVEVWPVLDRAREFSLNLIDAGECWVDHRPEELVGEAFTRYRDR